MLFLLCHYSDNCCALRAQNIAEIIPLAKLRKPSGTAAHPTLRGVLDYRSRPLNVYDLGLLHNVEPCKELVSTRIIIFNVQDNPYGLLAEKVYDMIRLEEEDSQIANLSEGGWIRYNGELINLFDPTVLPAKERHE